jgi:hypothetical protein
MSNLYSKVVLTVIAGALTWIAVQSAVAPARSEATQCGALIDRPCYVAFSCNNGSQSWPDWRLCIGRNRGD